MTDNAFATASQLHRQGQLQAAEVLYRQLLQAQPNHLQALQMLAIAQMQLGQPHAALDTMQRATAIRPDDPDLAANLGATLEALGRLDNARSNYDAVLARHPRHLNALVNRSNVLRRLGHVEAALADAESAATIAPDNVNAWVGKAAALLELDRWSAALTAADRALALQPTHALALAYRGSALIYPARWHEALQSLERALQFHARLAEAWRDRGKVLHALSRHDEALASYSNALAIWTAELIPEKDDSGRTRALLAACLELFDGELQRMPEFAEAWYNRGNVLMALHRTEEAVASFDRVLALSPEHANALNNRARCRVELGQPQQAVLDYEHAVRAEPGNVIARYNLGNTLLQLDQPEPALEALEQALELQPDMWDAWITHGNALLQLKRYAPALASFDRALSARPTAPAWTNRGYALMMLKRFPEALVCFNQALQLEPDMAQALTSRGTLWMDTRHPEKALEDFERVLAIEPQDPETHWNKGNALIQLGRLKDAIACHERTLALDPTLVQTLRPIMHGLQHLVIWSRLQEIWPREIECTRNGASDSAPLPMLAHPDATRSDLRAAGDIYWTKRLRAETGTGPLPAPAVRPRLRVAYVSGDFRDHALARLTAGLFAAHDRQRVETYGISYSPPNSHPIRQRIEGSFEHFVDIFKLGDEEATRTIRELDLDIAVDLTGYTEHHRFSLFSQRIAQVQVNYLGYPATSGAACMDYIIGDRWVSPLDHADGFSEKLVLMPDSFQVNDDQRQIASTTPSRAELGLPERGFVFCCLNNTYKITPRMFDIWMRLLQGTPESVLWLLGDSETARQNLRAEAQARGVDPRRIVFVQRRPYEEYLAQYRQADLFLDTIPFNAGTTASDALWAGLPVLTQLGETFPGRMAASLLVAVGLPELVTHSPQEYEATALELARKPALLQAYRDRLAANTPTAALFDTRRFARHLERAFEHMVARARQGLPPEHFEVAALPPRP